MANNNKESSPMMMYIVILLIVIALVATAYLSGYLMGDPAKYKAVKHAVKRKEDGKGAEFALACQNEKEFVDKIDEYVDKFPGNLVKLIQGEIKDMPSC